MVESKTINAWRPSKLAIDIRRKLTTPGRILDVGTTDPGDIHHFAAHGHQVSSFNPDAMKVNVIGTSFLPMPIERYLGEEQYSAVVVKGVLNAFDLVDMEEIVVASAYAVNVGGFLGIQHPVEGSHDGYRYRHDYEKIIDIARDNNLELISQEMEERPHPRNGGIIYNRAILQRYSPNN